MQRILYIATVVAVLAVMVVPAWGASHEPQGPCQVTENEVGNSGVVLGNSGNGKNAVSSACADFMQGQAMKRQASAVVASEYQYEEEPNWGQYCQKAERPGKGGNACGQQGR